MKRYNPKDFEPKWQQKWLESGIYKADDSSKATKNYILDFFPYPSGSAMHVGHVRNYTISDVLSRYARMRGDNVLHPMGWDAFGLPAENYAIKTGISPQQAVAENTKKFKQQLMQMGLGVDWSREFASSDPEYYKWTQWFFKLLFERGLAYQKDSLQWWCETDKTVLANEQVEAGRCWRCGNPVTKKMLKQWFFKITEYADRLEADLEDLDWSDAIKSMQRNWIGRSKGAKIDFAIKDSDRKLTVFTTRPDTLFGVTFMVLAPEHPLVKTVTSQDQKMAVDAYVSEAANKSDVDRMETNREKTGVFTGAYAVNPATKKEIPIYIADYVLMGYGTGAIMAVPAHDERDHEFAKKFDLLIVPVVAPNFYSEGIDKKAKFIDRPTANVIGYDPKTNKYCVLDWHETGRKGKGLDWPGGGIDEGETIEKAAIREFIEETGYSDVTLEKVMPFAVAHHFSGETPDKPKRGVKYVVKLRVNSLKQNKELGSDDYEKGSYTVKWATKEEILANQLSPANKAISEFAFGETIHVGEGSMINSGAYDGQQSADVRETLVADLAKDGVAKEHVNYRMRDWLISRQRYWGAPIPIVHCPKDGAVAVPDDQLPIKLPEMKSYEPSGDGRSPLARVPEWVSATCPKCSGLAERETDTMDGFACSSWYFLRFADTHNNDAPFDKGKAKYWLPVDTYIGGAEHAVMHLLYARFWTKVMFDTGLIGFEEPFKALRNHGMILAQDGRKMSKSYGNVIAPDSLIADGYGADSIRIMELFIAPWNQQANWSTEGMGGCYRFLNRFWTLAQEVLEHPSRENESDVLPLRRLTHKTIRRVTEDLEEMGFNTAISAMMEATNELYKLRQEIAIDKNNQAWRETIQILAQLLAPFAPHISEELWSQLGNKNSIHTSPWPTWDDKYLVESTMKIVVQINGKVRATLDLPAESSEENIKQAALADKNVQEFTKDKEITKIIYVPGKLLSLVVK